MHYKISAVSIWFFGEIEQKPLVCFLKSAFYFVFLLEFSFLLVFV